ncbi:type I-E CRISPR-associated protein Cas7/Cse4/CasC [Methanosphaerula subterraneus]|uniref:type I-E CRISPR-associated protein Cas7/Cse4/CasC n=1 Tax=Methanosphaerula subterraneus TaxID=3350244 RepID=UPI003F8702C9
MTDFIQFHMLISYPPSNLNRDELGRPKMATMGMSERLRISSQSLKRAWRTSQLFQQEVMSPLGKRTRGLGERVQYALLNGLSLYDLLYSEEEAIQIAEPIPKEKATRWAARIAEAFVDNLDKKKEEQSDASESSEPPKKKGRASKKSNIKEASLGSQQIVFIAPSEISKIDQLLSTLRQEKDNDPTIDQLKELLSDLYSVDIAMFGRMLANAPSWNAEAAVQVAHAITVHEAAVEDDYFTAVDDLNRDDQSGAAHLNITEFGAGVFYLYVCVDRDGLLKNLKGKEELTDHALEALVKTMTQVSPTGKQASFASRASAQYLLAERGPQQPRSLSAAFLSPRVFLSPEKQDEFGGFMGATVAALEDMREKLNKIYGQGYIESRSFNVDKGTGSLAEILELVKSSPNSAGQNVP